MAFGYRPVRYNDTFTRPGGGDPVIVQRNEIWGMTPGWYHFLVIALIIFGTISLIAIFLWLSDWRMARNQPTLHARSTLLSGAESDYDDRVSDHSADADDLKRKLDKLHEDFQSLTSRPTASSGSASHESSTATRSYHYHTYGSDDTRSESSTRNEQTTTTVREEQTTDQPTQKPWTMWTDPRNNPLINNVPQQPQDPPQ